MRSSQASVLCTLQIPGILQNAHPRSWNGAFLSQSLSFLSSLDFHQAMMDDLGGREGPRDDWFLAVPSSGRGNSPDNY